MQGGKQEILNVYGNRLRVRVCGICISGNRILMVRHHSIGEGNIFWSPPGGGMEFGESATEALVREFQEECGVLVEVEEMLFVYEHLHPPLHAIEIFFRVKYLSGTLTKGFDPEFSVENQIIEDVCFMDMADIKELEKTAVHAIFQNCETLDEVLSVRGYNGKMAK